MDTIDEVLKTQIDRIQSPKLKQWIELQDRPHIKTVKSIVYYESKIADNPEDPNAYLGLGVALHWASSYALAREMYDRANSLVDDFTHGLFCSADLYSTCPEDRYRNGSAAVVDVKRATELLDHSSDLQGYSWLIRQYLTVCAAAHAEYGDHQAAAAAISRALLLCETRRAESEVKQLAEVIERREPIRAATGLVKNGPGKGWAYQ